MKALHAILSAVILSGIVSGSENPNILFIYLDDFGWKDTSYMGSDFFETPHIDKLAREGMIFTNAYSGAANCAPARACLLSGQYSPRHEIYNVGTGPRGKSAHRKLKYIPGVSTLREDIVTWAQCLQKANYETATMGKWHLSSNPLPYGFDLNVGGTHSGGPPNGYYPPHGKAPNLRDVPESEYVTDTLSHRACDFIRENKDRHWALYLTHFAVHTPIQGKKELLPKYRAKTPGTQHNNVEMATMIQAVDDGVGLIVAELEKQGLRKNTVILFYSDNGGYGPATDMAPLKGYKGTYYEGGIRVPFFVNWPGQVSPGESCDTPVTGVDMYPTLCEIAGATLPAGQPLDGKSLVPVVTGKDATELADRAIFWHFPAYLQSYARTDQQRDPLFRSRPCSVVRKGDWKLHEYFEDGGFELYNLANDIGETNNLAGAEPEKLQELQQELITWRNTINAPVPTEKNPAYDAEAEKAALTAPGKRNKNRKKG
ncbi:MAG: sulfatase [Verrucomicrobiales bacterium]|nr:sulfatase [Verrucomicrobiales bacterium]